uniref:Uncharacterized protein n=1 Tax=Arundo donax TaxID=35708 RepID=A0A0A8YFZ9_ARUDO
MPRISKFCTNLAYKYQRTIMCCTEAHSDLNSIHLCYSISLRIINNSNYHTGAKVKLGTHLL